MPPESRPRHIAECAGLDDDGERSEDFDVKKGDKATKVKVEEKPDGPSPTKYPKRPLLLAIYRSFLLRWCYSGLSNVR